jgi:hypothetical protein
MKALAALNIGRLPDGKFRGSIDLPEQGAKDIPATSVTANGTNAVIKWDGLQASFNGRLSGDGNQLSGWFTHMGGKSNEVTFSRLDGPFQLLPKEISYTPKNAEDALGYWKGTLDAGPQKLHLIFHIGRTPDGTIAGTLASPDQGGQEIPMSTGSFTTPSLKMEWKGIRGKFEGELSKDGQTIDGKWEQFGNPMPLKLERSTDKDANAKS